MNYKTNISIETFLDKDLLPLVKKIYPFVTETNWIGKMNYIKSTHENLTEKKYYDKVKENYTLENLQTIVNSLYELRNICYKDSIQKRKLKLPYYQVPNLAKTLKYKKTRII